MSGLDVAAGVIAVVQISAKVASRCAQYSREVSGARSDIARIRIQLDELQSVLDELQRLLHGNLGAQLVASRRLRESLNSCHSQLVATDEKLKGGNSQKLMKRFGMRAFRWPFARQEVDKIVRELRDAQTTIQLALQVDTVKAVQDIVQHVVLARLAAVGDAAFDSYRNQHEARCHPNTRLDLLKGIKSWAEDPRSRIIYWLCGMAGTGKSTIAYTVAQSLSDRRQPGASFFFKRGEGDRGNPKRLFATIASQMVSNVPELASAIRETMDATPNISEKRMKDQFEGLLLRPLQTLKFNSFVSDLNVIVIVVDALDECENEDDVKTLLGLLTQTQKIKRPRFRVFVTSRPELPIRLGFKDMAQNLHHDVFLHEIAKDKIDHDLSQYLSDELSKIRLQRSLNAEWPGESVCQELVQTASPLFIFAATMSRFISDPIWDAQEQLEIVLRTSTQSQTSRLYQTYSPVFERLLTGCDERQAGVLVREFQRIVGSIVVLEEPLPYKSISRLLDMPSAKIYRRLDALHSVLDLPDSNNNDRPVRMLHLSFRDFLLNPQKQRMNERDNFKFWVDETRAHTLLARRCLELLRRPGVLKKNICNLESPGTEKQKINKQQLERSMPLEIQYACRYWGNHVARSRADDLWNEAYELLQTKVLYWIEAMSLLGRLADTLVIIANLAENVSKIDMVEFAALLTDAKRFILAFRPAIERTPLQAYDAGLIFAPESCIIRSLFQHERPKWVLQNPEIEVDWGPLHATLEGHASSVWTVAFSPDGRQVVTGAHENTIRLWDAESGAALETFTVDAEDRSIWSVAFSPDGKVIASGHSDTVRLWDIESRTALSSLEGEDSAARCAVFSPDGKYLATGTIDHTIILWSTTTETYKSHRKLQGHRGSILCISFSPDCKQIASSSTDEEGRLWDVDSGLTLKVFRADQCSVLTIAFSPDGKFVASAMSDGSVRLWSTSSGNEFMMLGGSGAPIASVGYSAAFMHSGYLISGTHSGAVKVWELKSGTVLAKFDGHNNSVTAVAFSPDGKRIASGSADQTIRLWDVEPATSSARFKPAHETISTVAFSPDGKMRASGLDHGAIRLHDVDSGLVIGTVKAHDRAVFSVAFSPDGKKIATGSVGPEVVLSDVESKKRLATFEGHSSSISCVAFSPDGSFIASASRDDTIKVWQVGPGTLHATLRGHAESVCSVAFLPDSQRLAWGSDDGTIKLWDVESGSMMETLHVGSTARQLSFSTDGARLDSDQGRLILAPSGPASDAPQQNMLSLAGQWIMLGSEELLWLPANHRPVCHVVDQNSVLLGYRSGVTSRIGFDISKMEFI